MDIMSDAPNNWTVYGLRLSTDIWRVYDTPMSEDDARKTAERLSPNPKEPGAFYVAGRMNEYPTPGDFNVTSQARRPHPGEVLYEEFLRPWGVDSTIAATALDIEPRWLLMFLDGDPSMQVSEFLALKLSAATGTTPEFWLNLQNSWALSEVRRTPSLMNAIAEVKTLRPTG